MTNFKLTAVTTTILTLSASAAMAGCIIPLPAAGLGGPVALIVAIGAAGAYKFYRSRQK
jgi:hypothetical protein